MNGRMAGFTLDPRSPNVVAPGKRPMHTLNNFLVHDPAGNFMLAGVKWGGGPRAGQTRVLSAHDAAKRIAYGWTFEGGLL